MRAVIQLVKESRVIVDQEIVGEIGQGLLVLLGVEESDTEEDMKWLCRKIVGLRIFVDDEGKMNRSVQDVDGDILVVSQFTLFASTKKGNRPSFIRSAPQELAQPMYEKFVAELKSLTGKPIETGTFGAMMHVELINDGPVTIIIDTKDKQ